MRIITDSAADMNLDLLQELKVDLVPMTIQVEQEALLDDKTIEMKKYWDLMKEKHLKTSQPMPSSFLSIFEDVKEKNEEAIFISISSSLSGTYSQAFLAKDMVDYDKIYIIDSKTATLCQAQIVFYACQLRDQGYSTLKIIEKIESFKSKVHLYLCVDTLEYLARGGRLPKTVSVLGNAIKIKPILTINTDGIIEVVKMTRGKKKAIQELKDIHANANIEQDFPIIPIYSENKTNCEELLDTFENHAHPYELGLTIGVHVGPGSFGFVCVEK